MEQRQYAVEHLAAELQVGHPRGRLSGVRAQVAVRQDRGLRPPGGAARELQDGDVVEGGRENGCRDAPGLHERRPGGHALRPRSQGQRGTLLARSPHGQTQQQAHPPWHGIRQRHGDDPVGPDVGGELRDGVGHGIPHDRDLRVMHLEQVPQLGCCVARIVLDDDRTEPLRGVERDDVLRSVRHDQRDPVARPHTHPVQGAGDAAHLVGELAIGRDGAEELQRGALGVARDRLGEHVDESLRHRLDVSRHAVRVGREPGPRGEGVHPLRLGIRAYAARHAFARGASMVSRAAPTELQGIVADTPRRAPGHRRVARAALQFVRARAAGVSRRARRGRAAGRPGRCS